MNSSVSVAILLAFLFLMFWTLDRMRLAKRLRLVSRQHHELQSVLSGFMEEFEKITMQFSRLISTGQANTTAAELEVPELLRYGKVAMEPLVGAFAGNGIEKRHLVLGLARKGGSVGEIAGRLMIPSGEVELILNLSQKNERVDALPFKHHTRSTARKRNSG